MTIFDFHHTRAAMSVDVSASMTPEELERTPAARPPEDIEPNLVDPPSQGMVLVITGGIFMALMLLVAGLRYYMKFAVIRKRTPDDCEFFANCNSVTALLIRSGTTMAAIVSWKSRKRRSELLILLIRSVLSVSTDFAVMVCLSFAG